MRVRDYGHYIRINVNQDLTSRTIAMELYSPGGKLHSTITTTDGLLIPGVDFNTGEEIYLANQYTEYKFPEGLINLKGTWKVVITAEDAPLETFKVSSGVTFNVTSS